MRGAVHCHDDDQQGPQPLHTMVHGVTKDITYLCKWEHGGQDLGHSWKIVVWIVVDLYLP